MYDVFKEKLGYEIEENRRYEGLEIMGCLECGYIGYMKREEDEDYCPECHDYDVEVLEDGEEKIVQDFDLNMDELLKIREIVEKEKREMGEVADEIAGERED